jgi:CDP-4-dehydro-6-deoxyglucose reductase
VTKVEPLSEDRAVLHLRTPRTQSLRFMAGQKVRLTDEDGNSGQYSIASCPCDGRNLEMIIRRHSEDPFARAVMERRIRSQGVLVEGPSGDFVLREESTRPALFVAFGDGFAPIKSLLEQAISIDVAEHLHLYRIDEPLGPNRLDNLCRAWNDSLDTFSLVLLEPELPMPEVLARIRDDIPHWEQCDIYVAGPARLVSAFLDLASTSGVDLEQIQCTPED